MFGHEDSMKEIDDCIETFACLNSIREIKNCITKLKISTCLNYIKGIDSYKENLN